VPFGGQEELSVPIGPAERIPAPPAAVPPRLDYAAGLFIRYEEFLRGLSDNGKTQEVPDYLKVAWFRSLEMAPKEREPVLRKLAEDIKAYWAAHPPNAQADDVQVDVWGSSSFVYCPPPSAHRRPARKVKKKRATEEDKGVQGAVGGLPKAPVTDPDDPYAMVRAPDEEEEERLRAMAAKQGAVPKRRFVVGSPEASEKDEEEEEKKKVELAEEEIQVLEELPIKVEEASPTSSDTGSLSSSNSSADLPIDAPRQVELSRICQRGLVGDGTMIPKGNGFVVSADYESMNYRQSFCPLSQELHRRESEKRKEESSSLFPIFVFSACLVIGATTGLCAFGVFLAIEKLSDYKYTLFAWILDRPRDWNDWQFLPDEIYVVAVNAGLCLVAGVIVLVAPVAVGSGIPHVKAYLNGIDVPELLRAKTLVVKMTGVVFSVLGGLPVGKEGPMIHAGSVIGGGIPQLSSTTFNLDWRVVAVFRSDFWKRDFVSAGAAAGVSAAFGAPLGGVLFALEEGISHWSNRMTLMCLTASFGSYYALNTLKAFYDHEYSIAAEGLAAFGVFDEIFEFTHTDVAICFMMGVLGGLLGGVWNWVNEHLTIFRMRFIFPTGGLAKMADVLIIGCLSTVMALVTMDVAGDCKPFNSREANNHLIQMSCEDGDYNTLAAICKWSPFTLAHFHLLSLSLSLRVRNPRELRQGLASRGPLQLQHQCLGRLLLLLLCTHVLHLRPLHLLGPVHSQPVAWRAVGPYDRCDVACLRPHSHARTTVERGGRLCPHRRCRSALRPGPHDFLPQRHPHRGHKGLQLPHSPVGRRRHFENGGAVYERRYLRDPYELGRCALHAPASAREGALASDVRRHEQVCFTLKLSLPEL